MGNLTIWYRRAQDVLCALTGPAPGQNTPEQKGETIMAKWVCTICGYECEGDTPEVPCPVCGAGEEAYEKVEE